MPLNWLHMQRPDALVGRAGQRGRLCLPLLLFSFSLVAVPAAAEAQQPAKVPRIGFLSGHFTRSSSFEPFSQGMRELGYTDYKDFVIEPRGAGGDPTALPVLAAELVELKVDVIVADSTPAALAVKRATTTIPIVAVSEDPVGSALVASLARPGGNVTGLSTFSLELGPKRLDLLKQAVPKVSRVALLWSSALRAEAIGPREMEVAARAVGVKLSWLGPRRPPEYDTALAAATKERAGALIFIGGSGNISSPAEQRIVELATRRRLPAMYDLREYAEAGGLMAYGPNLPDIFRRAATYVDKILKGAKPADLPVEQPTRFELVINLKTAKALGLTIPQSVLIRADQVIQ